jgi:hypothetical protein
MSHTDLGFEDFVAGLKVIPNDLNAIAELAKGYNELMAQFPHAGIDFGEFARRGGEVTPEDYGRLYQGLPIDGQTTALIEAVNNNTTALQTTKTSDDTATKDMADAAAQMKSLVESMSQSAETGQPVQLVIDGYKFGEFVLKQLGTIMHVRLAGS